MPFNAVDTNQKLASSQEFTSQLVATCRRIAQWQLLRLNNGEIAELPKRMGFSLSWSDALNAAFLPVRDEASIQINEAVAYHSRMLTLIVACGQLFASQRTPINGIFDQTTPLSGGQVGELQAHLSQLREPVQQLQNSAMMRETELSAWEQQLEAGHQPLAVMVTQLKAEVNPFQPGSDSDDFTRFTEALEHSITVLLSAIESAEQTLDTARIDWSAFLDEIDGVIHKINNAQTTDELILQRVWFNAACEEWDLVMTAAQRLTAQSPSAL